MFKKKKKTNYFEGLKDLAAYTVHAADYLLSSLESYEPKQLSASLEAMHKIEHSADLALHELSNKLAREFITPIERQDIFSIANMIDDVTDSIEDVLMCLYMYNVATLREEALEFAKVIVACSGELIKLMGDFEDFRKSDNIRRPIIEINDLEEEGDAIYVRSIRKLYEEKKDPIDVVAWTEIYSRLETCCDNFEDVSQTIEHVIMKNT